MSDITSGAGPLIAALFTGRDPRCGRRGGRDVAKKQLQPKAAELRAYEQVEWTRAVTDHWLAVQAYEGSLRAIEAGDATARFAALSAKETVAELAEATLGRLSR